MKKVSIIYSIIIFILIAIITTTTFLYFGKVNSLPCICTKDFNPYNTTYVIKYPEHVPTYKTGDVNLCPLAGISYESYCNLKYTITSKIIIILLFFIISIIIPAMLTLVSMKYIVKLTTKKGKK